MVSNAASHFRKCLLRLCVLVVLSITFGAAIHAQSPAISLPPGPGRDLVAVACTQCHGLKLIVALRDGPVGWKEFVNDMILRGAQLDPREADMVIRYLASNFGPGNSPMQSSLKTEPLPPGDGEKLVESHCTICHDLGRITAIARSEQEWKNTVRNMMERSGSNVATPEQIQTMTSYLAAHFSAKKSD
jgi:mono/diheme cytochrome c family protein